MTGGSQCVSSDIHYKELYQNWIDSWMGQSIHTGSCNQLKTKDDNEETRDKNKITINQMPGTWGGMSYIAGQEHNDQYALASSTNNWAAQL